MHVHMEIFVIKSLEMYLDNWYIYNSYVPLYFNCE